MTTLDRLMTDEWIRTRQMNRINVRWIHGQMDRVLVGRITTLYHEHSWLSEIGVSCSFGWDSCT